MQKFTKQVRISNDMLKMLNKKAVEMRVGQAFLLDAILRNALPKVKVNIVIEEESNESTVNSSNR